MATHNYDLAYLEPTANVSSLPNTFNNNMDEIDTQMKANEDSQKVVNSGVTLSFSWGSGATPPEVDNQSSRYRRMGKMVEVTSRFRIVTLNAPQDATSFVISMPDGVTADNTVGPVGFLLCPGNKILPVRSNGSQFRVATLGGGNVSGDMETGFHQLHAVFIATSV